MKNQIIKIIFLFLIILFLLIGLSYLLNFINYLYYSNLFEGKLSLIEKLLFFLPYSFILAILIFLLLLSENSENPVKTITSFLIIFISAVILYEFVYSFSTPKISQFDSLTEPVKKQEKENQFDRFNFNNKLKDKINKALNNIYFYGNYEEAIKILEKPLAFFNIKVPENNIVFFLISLSKKKLEEEKERIKRAKLYDSNFDRGYNYLLKKQFSNAEKYFRHNITHENKYFHQKALTLLQRQGQMNIDKSMIELIHIRQLKELGKLVEKNYHKNPRFIYDYYNQLHMLYGEKAISSELLYYSKLISIDEITDEEIKNLKNKDKRANLFYITDIKIIDKQTGASLELKNVFFLIKYAYFTKNSETVYFENISIIDNFNKKYFIELARFNKDTGIFNNFVFDTKTFKTGIIKLKADIVNIINFKPELLSSNKLSIFYYLSSKINPDFNKIMRLFIKDKINYYLGFLISFILAYLICLLLKVNKNKKIKTHFLFYILPLLVIIIITFLILQFSYFLSNKMLEVII